jgi:DNA polymerase-3 subunit alpha
MRYEFHAHTDASNIRGLDCINKTEALIQYAHDLGLNGIAITDHETLTNHIKAIKYIKKAKEEGKIREDFKLVLGNEIYLVDSSLNQDTYDSDKHSFFHFILLAKDKEGHKQLRELSTRAWERSFYTYVERVPTYYEDI